MPKVAFIISAYNSADTLPQTLASLRLSTLSDWEAIVVNDRSQDETGDILEGFSSIEPRLKVIHNEENIGLAASLNKCIDAARSPYLARIDADDILLPDRIFRQAEYLEECPDVGVVGTGAYIVDAFGKYTGYKAAIPTSILPWAVLWRTPFIHPSVMMRYDVIHEFNLRYDPDLKNCEDFEFWGRLLRVTHGANLEIPGICYRVHTNQVTKNNVDFRLDLHREISKKHLSNLMDIPVTDSMLEAQRGYFLGEKPRGQNVPNFEEALEWRTFVARIDGGKASDGAFQKGFGFDLLRGFKRFSPAVLILGGSEANFRRMCVINSAKDFLRYGCGKKIWEYRSTHLNSHTL